MTCAGGVAAAQPALQRARGGATPTPALQPTPRFGAKDLLVRPIPHKIARRVCEQKHYLRSYPGGAMLAFGVFVGGRLLGVGVLGVGPANIRRLFQEAQGKEVACLARLWLDDRLGRNGESRTLGIILRCLRREQDTIKAVVAYSDPAAGHTGIIYRAAGFLYLGPSQATPLYSLNGGRPRHSRSLSHSFGSHSIKHFKAHGVEVELVEQSAKHTYIALVDPSWRERLARPVLPYLTLQQEIDHGDS